MTITDVFCFGFVFFLFAIAWNALSKCVTTARNTQVSQKIINKHPNISKSSQVYQTLAYWLKLDMI